MNSDKGAEPVDVISRKMQNTMFRAIPVMAGIWSGTLILASGEERGAHVRGAFGVSQIPFSCCVEIEMVVETFVSESECEL
jgi:hypothetical protein